MSLRLSGLVALLTVGLCCSHATAGPARYLRHPALSPDNSTLAFSYRGDIWVVAAAGGRAERLTVHPGRDQRPIWSPDGRELAFASDREGQIDVYVIPAEGGSPRRLTFSSSADYPCDWSPDGQFVLTEQSRIWRPDLFEIPAAGGVSRPVTGVPGEGEYFARYSADGKTILFCDGGGYARWWWEGNRSARAGQIWTLKRNSWPPDVSRVTAPGTQYLWPGYAEGNIVATSNAAGVANIVRLSGEDVTPLTQFQTEGVRWLRVSKDGSRAVFERDMRLWEIDLSSDSVSEIRVEAPSDWVVAPQVKEAVQGKITEFTLSPDGRRIAFVAGGELYLIPSADPKKARRLTRTDAREQSPVFSPDGKQLAYVSDRNGRQNLYQVNTRSGREVAITALTNEDVAKPQYAPDGETIAFYLGNDRIARIPSAGGEIDTLLLGRYFDFPLETTQEFRFSPDGAFIAYTAFGSDYNTDIWIFATDGRMNVDVTRRSQYNYDPRWSPDGKYLTFVHSHMQNRDIYVLHLEKRRPEFPEAQLDSLYDVEDSAKAKTEGPDGDLAAVKIDVDQAHKRWQRILPMAARQSELLATPDGKYWLFVADLPGGENIWRVPVDEESDSKPLQLTSGRSGKGRLVIDPQSKTVYYLENGKIGRVGIDGKEQKTLSFDAEYDYNTTARHAQKLTEVWRMLGNYFYDRDLHGAAWENLRAKYAAALPHVALDEELRELLREFVGGLNASHLNIYGGKPGLPTDRQSGFLGCEFSPLALRDGTIRLARVYAGGPVDQGDVTVEVGDTLTAINGASLTAGANFDSLMVGTIGDRTVLTFAGPEGSREVAVKPISASANRTLQYEQWVDGRRAFVDSVSQGRIGYLHVRSMNQTALDRFKRELADQTAPYDGLVVDVRYNGGGWIAVHLLGMLERKPFVLRNFRGAATVSENKSRAYAVEKPMILLINHFSASNSEIFAEGWRRLELGKIVGYPTSAAVIGTAAYRLIDGTICRRPSWGAYTVDMENLEGNGRQPDIRIFNTQKEWLSGQDPQLERAVKELLTELR